MYMERNIIKYEIYCDGSSVKLGNKLFGGWSYIIKYDTEILEKNSGAVEDATNQKMELTAAIKAIEAILKYHYHDLNSDIVIYSDSAYLVNCWLQKWWINWQKNGWVNAKKAPVANRDLWERLIPYFRNKHIRFTHVKGHADNYYNNMCDELAVQASTEMKNKWRVAINND